MYPYVAPHTAKIHTLITHIAVAQFRRARAWTGCSSSRVSYQKIWRLSTACRLSPTGAGSSWRSWLSAWLAGNPIVGSVIAGATSAGQVVQNAAAGGITLSAADRAEIEVSAP